MKVPVGMILLTLSGAAIGLMARALLAEEWYTAIIALSAAFVLQVIGANLIGRGMTE